MFDTYDKPITPGFFDTKIGIKLFNSLIKNNVDSEIIRDIENDLSIVSCCKKYNDDEKQIANKYFNEMTECLEEAECPLSPTDISVAHVAFISDNGLSVNDNKNISDKDKLNINSQLFQEIFDACRISATYRNIDFELVQNTFNEMFSEQSYESTLPKEFIVNTIYTSSESENTTNFNKDFFIHKLDKGNCQARHVNSNELCKNKTEGGKICCSEHQPLTQEQKRIINENKSGTFSSNGSETAQSESSNNENYNSDKCKYINGKGQCKNPAYAGQFCKKCHKIHFDESSIHQSNDYCTIITKSGINKGRVCGEKSCGKGLHVCTTHRPKENMKKCGHTNTNGITCNNNVTNPFNKKCGLHINSTSYVHCESQSENKKSEALLEWEQEQREKANQPVQYCQAICGNGNVCNHKTGFIIDVSIVEGIINDKIVCWMHHESLRKKKEKEKEKGKTHRCLAKCGHGGQCQNKNVPESNLYCDRHYDYDPDDQCGAFDEKTEDRCSKKCEIGKDFCKGHKNYTADPIKDDVDVYLIQGWLKLQELYEFNNQYTVVCVDPPKKVLKLKIVEDNPSNQKPLRLILEGEGYGLDCFVSDSEEESACTEESELEIIQPQVVAPKRSIIPEEFELVNKATGWTEEQIKIMKNKRIFKRSLGPKKKFNLEQTLFETRKNLEQYFVNAINKANGKYEGCKKQLENLIKATHFDLSASVENVIGLFGVQRFSSRTDLLDNCKDSLRDLRNLESLHKKKIENLPVPVTKKQLVKMDTEKYVNAFNDVINTVKKEQKEDIKYIKEFDKFISGSPKKPKYDREEKRKEFNQKYRDYFEKYIVRFAKVSLHKENSKGRLFGFANYFIDLLNEKPLDYTRFRDAYGGEIRNEDNGKVFYCDVFTIITNIINNHKVKNDIMDYLDVDISTNLSSSEHQTSWSQELRECQRTGKTTSTVTSMLEVGVVEKFAAKNEFYEGVEWVFDEESRQEFNRGIVGFSGNLLAVNARENNYPNYAFSTTQAPDLKVARWVNSGNKGMREEISDEIKPSYENNVEEILGMNI